MRSLVRPLSCVALAAAAMAGSPSLPAQSPSSASHVAKDSLFTAEDGLDVVTYNALDLTSDGRWLAATSASRRDGLGVDYRRDGDPTYIRPAAARVWVIDTRTVTPSARARSATDPCRRTSGGPPVWITSTSRKFLGARQRSPNDYRRPGREVRRREQRVALERRR